MFNIVLASLSVGIGSYVLRKGDLFGVLLFFLKKNIVFPNTIIMTFLGIFLNLIGIYFWQESAKSTLPYHLASSFYLSLTLVIGIIISIVFDKIEFNLNLFLGTIFLVAGLIILSVDNI